MKAGRLTNGESNLDGDRGEPECALEASPDLSSPAQPYSPPDPSLAFSQEAGADQQLQAYLDHSRAPKQRGFPPLDALSARLGEFPPPIHNAEAFRSTGRDADPRAASPASDFAWFEERFSELKGLLAPQQIDKGEIISINTKLAEIAGQVDRLSSAIPKEKTVAAVESRLAALSRSLEAGRGQGVCEADRIARAAKEILAATERAEEARAGFENAARHTVRELGQTVTIAATQAAVVTAERFAAALQRSSSSERGGMARVEQQLRDLNAHSRQSSERTTEALDRVQETLRLFVDKGPAERIAAPAPPKKRAGVHMPIAAGAPAYSRSDAYFGAELAPKPRLDTITLRTPPPRDPNLLIALQEATERMGARRGEPIKGEEGERQPPKPSSASAPFFREEEKALPLFGLGIVAIVLLIASAALYYLQTQPKLPPFHLTVLPDLQDARVAPARAETARSNRPIAESGAWKLPSPAPKEAPGLFTAADQTRAPSPPKPEAGEDLQMLTTAASRGDREAQFRIGARFLSDGAQADPATAARWLARAAEQGHTESQFVLASLYERGAGVPKDEGLARELYRKAASAGHIRAMHNLGVLLAAQDTPQDYQEAARWFMSAAAAGLMDSQFNLALLYERGLGIEQDNRKAYFWYQVAALAGDKEAGVHAERLRRQLPEPDSEAASEEAGAWRPTSERLPGLASGNAVRG